jgi:serine/threonine protein kinase
MPLLRDGQIIRDTYEVERELGEGAFAEVYRVRHRFLGRQAMKVFKSVGMTMDEIETMLGEAILLSGIGHPNIIRVFDANTVDTPAGVCGFFTMEYIAGGSLEQFWQSFGDRFMPVETAVEIVQQVSRGLALAHGESPPIVHRDIKPQNILVGYDQGGVRARLCDFGLAKHVNPLTLAATTMGTRCFKAPEAFRARQGDSIRGDVWSLGATLYLILTDRLPYGDEGDEGGDSVRFDRPLTAPSRINLDADDMLDHVTQRALSLDAEQRYADARAFLADLERWQAVRRGGPDKVKSAGSPDDTKSALGSTRHEDDERGAAMARDAVQLARETGRLTEAADMMEQAMNLCPELRERHEYSVRLWRRGIAM